MDYAHVWLRCMTMLKGIEDAIIKNDFDRADKCVADPVVESKLLKAAVVLERERKSK